MSDEVTQFLEQVERLRGQQIEDDEMRARELDQFLAAKRERQARREERARSISPQKSSPVNTPSPRAKRRSGHPPEPLKPQTPTPATTNLVLGHESTIFSAVADADASPLAMPSSPVKENEAPADAPDAASSPLSWQRRSNSHPGARPLSLLAAQNATQRSLIGAHEPAADKSTSPERVVHSTLSKDTNASHQIVNRPARSPSYRRDQIGSDGDQDDLEDTPADNRGYNSKLSIRTLSPGSAAIETPSSRSLSRHGITSPTYGMLGSPITLDPPRQDSPANETSPTDQSLTSPTGRTSPLRSASPTKGMGGFVQSAMMKRSDSVKRWSVTSPPGLSRAGNRTSYDRGSSQAGSRPQSMMRNESPTRPSSRPVSRYGGGGDADADLQEEASTSGTPANNRDSASAPVSDRPQSRTDDVMSPPSSQTKTDSRRWSPSKSSWLENALNKPEASPKTTPKAAQSQPAWMVELNKAKAERAAKSGADTTRSPGTTHKHQVSIGGLMRQSPMGGEAVKTNPTGLGGIYSPPTKPVVVGQSHEKKPSLVDKTPSRDPDGAADSAPDHASSPAPAAAAAERRRPSVARTVQPQTSPNDFRANLRQRSANDDASKSNEPEFKSAFGNLRPTTTQNYVAPDELKNNILRGKAALNQTDGPRKTQRKDEFKEAILQKREDFKKAQAEGRGITRGSPTTDDKSLPEGLVKKAELARAAAGDAKQPQHETHAPSASSRTPRRGPERTSSPSAASVRSLNKTPSPPSPQALPRSPGTEPKASKPGTTKTGRAPSKTNTPEPRTKIGETKVTRSGSESRERPPSRKESSPGRKVTNVAAPGGGRGNKLANRFNPALAGMLARGPPPMAAANNNNNNNDGTGSDGSGPGRSSGAGGGDTEPTEPGPRLTHMTKGRARGPKRKAPTGALSQTTAAVDTNDTEATPVPQPPEHEDAPAVDVPEQKVEPQSPVFTRKKPAPRSIETPKMEQQSSSAPKADTKQQEELEDATAGTKIGAEAAPEPTEMPNDVTESAVPESPTPGRRSKASPKKSNPKKKAQSPVAERERNGGASQPGSPKKLDMKRMSQFMNEAPSDDTSQPTSPKGSTKGSPKSRSRSKSPKKLPEPLVLPSPIQKDPVQKDTHSPVKSTRSSRPGSPLRNVREPGQASDEVQTVETVVTVPAAATATTATPTLTPKATPRFRDSLRPLSGLGGLKSPLRSPMTKQVHEVSTLLTDFFGHQGPRKVHMRVDAADLLVKRPATGVKVTSLGCNMFRMLADGKKVPVSAQNERHLFEQEMYVCAHHFADAGGRRVLEVYFWVGDNVGEAAISEARPYALREAQALGGRLLELRQGKETAEFLQALGGVVIVRRGSSNKYDSLAASMLCGRSHLGAVVFDEVDLAASSLCSGFAYLVARAGQCVLWKGKGSDEAEVGCARLVGMELTLTGELAEYDDDDDDVNHEHQHQHQQAKGRGQGHEGNKKDVNGDGRRKRAAFWEMLGEKGICGAAAAAAAGGVGGPGSRPAYASADHWRLKPSYDKYRSRLYRADADTEEQILEISPFTQTDLSPDGVYILDAFFETYVLVGSRARPHYPSFRIALDFAQEYAILAAGMEDRPFVPVSSVVLEGIPRDLKACFRKWNDGFSPTASVAGTGTGTGINKRGGGDGSGGGGGSVLKRGRSLRVVTLTQALQALRD